MKMNKLVAVVAAGMITMGAAVSASAAGVGYVNVAALLRAHPKFERAQLELQSTEQKLSADFEKNAKNKTPQQQQQLLGEAQRQLAEKQQSVMAPIQRDIVNAIKSVRKEKGLDIIIDQAAVIDGGEDVTAAVVQKVAK
ncbi:OmpH family outer membrane protein [Dialister micraerophilus]|uniref:OmpH family outer membrane protein n=1 Tax=Dialister micraerophilus TaxID=309120 RepID=UPI002551C800|nr:OmpH family outer membrane protein [Dialister micraerophilus]MDK8285657.1 OmpH family outer membrane protein [Dialister micraerophilus]